MSSESPSSSPLIAVRAFVGGGEMGKLVSAKDWSQTPLGPIENWSPSLLTAVNLVLNSNFPIALVWGAQYTQIYNDGYWPICGGKHPISMGQDFSECWASAFPVIGDAFRSALAGTTAFLEDQRIFVDRLGYLEETFFTFSFSPIRDEHGHVAGLFHPVTETTSKMIGQRRTRALRDLTAAGLGASTIDAALLRAAQALNEAALDVPFALFYRLDDDQRVARLVAQTGINSGATASPTVANLEQNNSAWPLARILAHGTTFYLDTVQTLFPGLVCGPYPELITAACAQTITGAGQGKPVGIMVFGLSTRLPMNQAYADFFELLGATVNNVVTSALAAEAERRRLDALAEIDRAKTVFFANISHEFRTPLTLMLAPLEDELANATHMPAPNRERLETAHRNALRLLKLVNTLLDFSRIEAGRVRANFQASDLTVLTIELADMFRSAVERVGLSFDVDCPNISEPIYVDHEMWEKIVLNLLANALKYTFSGGIRVALNARDDDVELTVTDTGVGIPANELPHLFERFHRVKDARARTHEGSGIGLALVQELVRLHGGVTSAVSIEGQGSTFTVRIPRGHSHLPAEQIQAIPAVRTNAAVAFIDDSNQWVDTAALTTVAVVETTETRPRIVWADDNADMRHYVTRLLSTDYAVTAVSNGEDALASALAQPPDLVLTDIMMPGLDGIGVLRALRADARTKLTPVILLSARAGGEETSSGLAEGADDYIVKPFAARELLARVRTHLAMAKLRREATATQIHAAQAEQSESESRKLLEAEMASRRALLSILESQQRAEAALRVSQETLHLTLDAAQIGYWDLNLVSHAATRSLRHDQIFGYAELLVDWRYETFLLHVHPEDRERVDLLFQSGVAAKSKWEFECRIVRADAVQRWIWGHGKVFTNATGDAVKMLGMVLDITARKQLEEALVNREKEFRSLAESMPQIVWATRADGWNIYFNQQWVEYTGLSLEESQGQGWNKPFHPDDQKRAWDAWQNAVHNRGSYALECRLRRADGVFRWWLIRGVPELDEGGNIVKWLGTCTDIEDIKLNEVKLREKNIELERFTYMISHDLKSPLVTIGTFLNYLEQDLAKSDVELVAKDMHYIAKAAEKMGRMLTELLEFTRVGRVRQKLVVVPWRDVVDEALGMVAGAIASRNVHVDIEDARVLLHGEKERLVQIWQNLLDNAAKFGGDQADLRVHIGVEGQGAETIFFVCDNGIGIDPRYHEKIFLLFERLDTSASGTGLGLAQVKRVVELYGGTIRVESRGLGFGASFRFTLPKAFENAAVKEADTLHAFLSAKLL